MSLIKLSFTEDIDDNYDEVDTTKKICGITGVEIKEDDDYDELPCGHVFLHNNILDWYKQTISFKKSAMNKSYFNIVQCPYCRREAKYLKLRKDETPLKGIHKEWKELSLKHNMELKENMNAIFKKGNKLQKYLWYRTVNQLKNYCRYHKWKGFSSYKNKPALIGFIIKMVEEHNKKNE